MTTLTLQEQERLAYIQGDVDKAALLQAQIDALEQPVEETNDEAYDRGYQDGYDYGLALGKAQMSAWQPIETAPRGGQKVLLAYVNRNGLQRTVVGGWVTDEEAAETDTDDVGLEAGWYERIDNWDDYYQVAIHEGEPTHWMPLPAAPEAL